MAWYDIGAGFKDYHCPKCNQFIILLVGKTKNKYFHFKCLKCSNKWRLEKGEAPKKKIRRVKLDSNKKLKKVVLL